VLFPDLGEQWIIGILIGGSVLALVVTALVKLYEMSSRRNASFRFKHQPPLFNRDTWRMPPLDRLPPARLSPLSRIWMIVLRGYLVVAGGLVLLRIFQLATVGA
jgi:hypothetical protein